MQNRLLLDEPSTHAHPCWPAYSSSSPCPCAHQSPPTTGGQPTRGPTHKRITHPPAMPDAHGSAASAPSSAASRAPSASCPGLLLLRESGGGRRVHRRAHARVQAQVQVRQGCVGCLVGWGVHVRGCVRLVSRLNAACVPCQHPRQCFNPTLPPQPFGSLSSPARVAHRTIGRAALLVMDEGGGLEDWEADRACSTACAWTWHLRVQFLVVFMQSLARWPSACLLCPSFKP